MVAHLLWEREQTSPLRKIKSAKKPLFMHLFGTLRKCKTAWNLRLTTVCPTSTQKAEKLNRYPGVAQLGARVVWDHQAAGSIPVTRTKKAQESTFLSLYFVYCGAMVATQLIRITVKP